MRHRREGRQLSRTTAHRKALLRNLVTSLFEHESITTTVAKAKEARPVAERLITLAKRGDLHARRLAARQVRTDAVNKKLFDTIGPWYKDRPGGYTRIVRVGRRLGDAGEIAVLSLVKTAEQIAAAAPVPVVEEPKKKSRFGFGGRKKADAAPAATAATSEAKPKKRSSRAERKASGEPAAPKPKKGGAKSGSPAGGARKTGRNKAAGAAKKGSGRTKKG